VAAAEGYRATDGYLMVEEDDPNPLILDLELTK
jgi:hypothetical protein